MPLSCTPSSFRNASASSGDRSTRSLSICALITTASQDRCVCTYSRTFITYGLVSAVARSPSFTLQAKMVGLSDEQEQRRGQRPFFRRQLDRERRLARVERRLDLRRAPRLPPPRPCRRAWRPWPSRSRRFCTTSRSASISSVLITSMSRTGSIVPGRRDARRRPRSSARPGRWRRLRGCG